MMRQDQSSPFELPDVRHAHVVVDGRTVATETVTEWPWTIDVAISAAVRVARRDLDDPSITDRDVVVVMASECSECVVPGYCYWRELYASWSARLATGQPLTENEQRNFRVAFPTRF